MGVAASIPTDKQAFTMDEVKAIVGDKFDETKFTAVATEGTITAAQLSAACAPVAATPDEIFAKVEGIRKSNPGNRCVKYFTRDYYNTLTPEQQATLYCCVRTGIDNKDSGLGCYAMKPSDYETFAPFFDKVIQDYHNGTAESKHVTDWDISAVGEAGVLDVTKLGLSELSMRVRVGRNLKAFDLPGLMDQQQRIKFERAMLPAFAELIADTNYGGAVYSMSPDHGKDADGNAVANPNLITAEKYQELVDAHVMFKDMAADPYLKSAGIASDWPYGRGCWQSTDQQCIIWFGEEDQLRIMCMKKGTCLNEVFSRLKTMLDKIEKIEGIEFATSDKYGYVTSCPSNLGTGMRASVHVKVPNLTSDGTDTKAKEICKPLGLSVRGTGGEHTPIGADGTIDLSPSARLFIKERDIVAALYEGIKKLMVAEKAAGETKAAEPAAAAAETKEAAPAAAAETKEAAPATEAAA